MDDIPMPKVVIVFDTVSGNTEKMAKAIAEGASDVKGVQVEVHKVGTPFPMSLLNEANAIILGSPTEYGNVTSQMKTFLESMAELKAARKLSLKGKIGGVFGSYEWDGGWAVDMLAMRMRKLGIKLIPPYVSVVGESTGVGTHIDQGSLEKCRELGKAVAVRTL